MRDRRRNSPEQFDTSPRAQAKRARRAAARGPVPEDPELLEAAREIAAQHRAELDRQRYWAPLLFVLMAVLAVAVALTGATWLWATVPVWIAAAVGHPYLRAQARRRAELLDGDHLPD
jgi:Flp pilus assembly protein TadB